MIFKKKIQATDQFPQNIPDHENRFTGIGPFVGYVDGINWRLDHDASYRTKAEELTTVRAGFIFDFATIPVWIQWMFPPAGDGKNFYGVAALFHDWLLEHKAIGGRPITRSEADKMFLEIMLYVGVNPKVAIMMYRAVCLNTWWQGGGWKVDGEPKEGNAT